MQGGARRLTLSFDNGPFPEVTPGVLDALAGAGATATFFVCGKDARDPARRQSFRHALHERMTHPRPRPMREHIARPGFRGLIEQRGHPAGAGVDRKFLG